MMEKRARREPELPAVVLSTAATVRPAALPGYREVLRHHRWGAGLVFVVLFAVTLVATLVPMPVYRATALVDGNGGTVVPLTRTLAERALARLDPGEDPLPAPPLVVARLLARATARVRRQLGLPVLEDPGPPAASADAVIDGVAAGTEIVPRTNSSFVEVSFTSPSPRVAADVANVLAVEYVAQAIAGAGDSGDRWRTVLERELQVTRDALTRAQEALQAFTRANPALSGDPRESLEYRKLADLNDALTKAQSRRMEKEALHKQVTSGNPGFLSQVVSNQVVAGLATEVAKLEGERARLGDGAAGGRVQAQIDALRRELRTAQEALADTVRADFEAAKKQEALLAQAVRTQRAVVGDVGQRAVEAELLKGQVDATRDRYERLLARAKDAPGGADARLVDRAAVPLWPSHPRPLLDLALAVGIGLLGSFAFGAVERRRDRPLRTAADIERSVGFEVLAVLPLFREKRTNGRRLRVAPELVAAEAPGSAGADAVARLRAALFHGNAAGPPQRLLVTSARLREGKTCVASNLALALAGAGRRVVLVDCDFRRPRLHRVFRREGTHGATSFLTGAADLPSLLCETDHGIDVLPAGPLPDEPAALIDSTAMASLLDELSRRYDYVVIDAPPVLGQADAPLLARLAGGVVLVVRAGETNGAAVAAAFGRLRTLRARVLGVVLNAVRGAALGSSARVPLPMIHDAR
ncbi:MAG: polysaccharide biosynthesis tyrosine autokinase [Deltaproteobacteria bacterium]|nr:MAG: polysaccharide biosynthesis tyrosine autokinase [Deltaproteobacteria bacterium]